MFVSCSALQVLAFALTVLRPVAAAANKVPHLLTQSFFFDWYPPGVTVPPPITAQCETIHIKWDRSTATGPDAVAPYYLQIYTSSFIFPFIVPAGSSAQTDLTIPWIPGTQYQICMFDSKGNTGGCQAVYTVYQNSTSTPSCANLTMPAEDQVLNVTSQSALGLFSQSGWIDSCTDLSLTPQTGTPPFMFTVAPALHPPINITSPDMSPINWTVSLSWASPFFISLADSSGKTWSNGPIHSGDGKTACLALDSPQSTTQISVPVTVGAAVGGLVLGALVSLLAAFVISRRRKSSWRESTTPFYVADAGNQEHEGELRRYSSVPSHSSPPLVPLDVQPFSSQHQQTGKRRPDPSSLGSIPREYRVEPFRREPSQFSLHAATNSSGTTGTRPRDSWDGINDTHSGNLSPTSPNRPSHQERGNQVYVIHHDSGRAPVSVVTSRGTEVVELPPGYSPEYLAADSSTAAQGSTSDASSRKTRSDGVNRF